MRSPQRQAWHALQLGPRWLEVEPPAAPVASSETIPQAAPPLASPEPLDTALAWLQLKSEIEACQACGLGTSRQHAVVGRGASQARCLLVGEAPGAEEDRQGLPFVGRAGALLDQMLAAIGLDVERDVYVTNTLKCRPPGNRNPEPQETRQCRPFFERQIALLEPRLIVALGRFAAQAVLQTDASIASLRGRLHRLGEGSHETLCIVTYHPAYLLRNPADKALAWRDWALVRKTLDEATA